MLRFPDSAMVAIALLVAASDPAQKDLDGAAHPEPAGFRGLSHGALNGLYLPAGQYSAKCCMSGALRMLLIGLRSC